MARVLDPPAMSIRAVKDCGYCHECGASLVLGGEDRDEEWCPRCCELKTYRSHGYAGFGDASEVCPYVDVEFLTLGHEFVKARGFPDGRRLLYEHHQLTLPATT